MLLKKYSKNRLTYDDVQFATALVLDDAQEYFAASVVLDFMCPAKLPKGSQDISGNRKLLIRYLESKETNIIAATLDYYFENKLFKSRYNRGRVHADTSRVPLGELISTLTKEELYQRVMCFMSTHPVDSYIVYYTKTHMFRKEFVKFVEVDGKRNGILGYNHVEDTAISELLNGFTSFVQRYCANGSYSHSSCTPNSFLFKRNVKGDGISDGPMAWYQKDSKSKYYEILKRRGLNSTLSTADNLALIDTVGVQLSKDDKEIKFIGLCAKINAASRLLFTHNRDSIAYYDIFSYHRSLYYEKTKKEFSNIRLFGCKVKFVDMKKTICADNTTLINKFNCRSAICDLFEKVFVSGIDKQKVCALYKEIISIMRVKCSGSSGAKDAKSPFDFPGYRSNEPGNNGSRFMTLLMGYSAMFELIDFLNSSSNVLGTTVNEFPVDIFRNKDLLVRVSSFEDYINNGDLIQQLYYEVANDSERSLPVRDGIMSNDSIYRYLGREKLLKNDDNLKMLYNTPIAVIQGAVSKFNKIDKDKELETNMRNVHTSWMRCGNCIIELLSKYNVTDISTLLDVTQLVSFPPEVLVKMSVILSNAVISLSRVLFITNIENPYTYLLICCFVNVLYALSFSKGDKLIHNSEGKYLIKDEDMLSAMNLSDDLPPEILSNSNLILIKRAHAIKLCMALLWGDDVAFTTPQILQEYTSAKSWQYVMTHYNASWEEYWHFWCVSLMLIDYVKNNNLILQRLYSVGQDLNMATIYAADDIDFFHLKPDITGYSQLEPIIEKVQYPLFIRVADRAKYRELVSRKQQKACIAFSRAFSSTKKQFDVYNTFARRADNAFGDLSGSHGFDDVEGLLYKASNTIRAMLMSGENNYEIASGLSVSADFDEYGYVLSGLNRFCLNSRIFVHKEGFLVDVDRLVQDTDIRKMTFKDLTDVRTQLYIGG